MISDLLVVGIILLMPLLAFFTLREEHLLHSIIGRGMLGIVAAIGYALMGSPDVAVTEALMGALLFTLLYVVVFTSAGEIRVGYVEVPILVQHDKDRLEGYQVEILSRFGKSAGLKPTFVSFENRETLIEAVQEGYMDMAIGPFVLPFDSGEGYLTLPMVETKVFVDDKGQWIDVLRARYSTETKGFDTTAARGEQGFYSVLLSEDAYDIRDMLFSFMGDEEESGIPDLRRKYLGERS